MTPALQLTSLVTGAASGIGAATARRLVDDERELILCDVDASGLARIAESLNVPAKCCIAGDLRDATIIDAVLSALNGRSVDRAILAAGVSGSAATADQILDINLGATMRLLDSLSPYMGSGSVIIVFGSLAAAAVGADEDGVLVQALRAGDISGLAETFPCSETAYAVSKRGLQLLARERAWSLRETGGRIISVTPGVIDTPMGHAAAAAHPAMSTLVQRSPAMRMGRPEEIAELVAYLVSPKAGFITGTDILIDGGASLVLSNAKENQAQ